MSDSYDVIVIGSGIGGLSAGLHLADFGYKTLILEAQPTPGGLCTSFERQDFTFDTCIHWLVGCGEGGMIWPMLSHFDLLPRLKLRRLDRFATIQTPDGRVTVGDDLDEFESFLCRLAPRDESKLRRLFRQVKSLPRMTVPSPHQSLMSTLRQLLSYWPMISLAIRYGRHTYESFIDGFNEKEKLRPYLLTWTDDSAALLSFFLFSWVYRQDMFTPQITSLDFSRVFESRFVEMGGEIRYRSRVSRILVTGKLATGVKLENGEELRAKVVVSNADGYQTLFGLLGREHVPDGLTRFYETTPLFGSMLLVSLGVGASLTEAEFPARMLSEFPTSRPTGIQLKDLRATPFTYKIESLYNPAVAPPGKGVVLVEALADYPEWKALHDNPQAYKEAKQKAGEIAVSRAEAFLPQIKGKVEVVDVATPVTFERYTANREGAIQGWKMTPKLTRRMNLPVAPTSVPNLFLAGQWATAGGGIPPCISIGAKAAALIHRYLLKQSIPRLRR